MPSYNNIPGAGDRRVSIWQNRSATQTYLLTSAALGTGGGVWSDAGNAKSPTSKQCNSKVIQPSVVTGTPSTDADTHVLALTASSVENAQDVDSATVAKSLTLVATNGDVVVDVDSATVVFSLIPSGTEGGIADANTVALALSPSETDIAADVEASTVTVALTPSAADTAQRVDTATPILALTPSSADTAQFVDSSTVRESLIPSSADIDLRVDSATAKLTFTPAGVDIYTVPSTLPVFPVLSVLDDFSGVDNAAVDATRWQDPNLNGKTLSNELAVATWPPSTAWSITYIGAGAPTTYNQAACVTLMSTLPALGVGTSNYRDVCRGVVLREDNSGINDEGYQCVIQRGDGGSNTTDPFAIIYLADHAAIYSIIAGPVQVAEPIAGLSVVGAVIIGTRIGIYYDFNGAIAGTSAIAEATDTYYPDLPGWPGALTGPSAFDVSLDEPMFDDFSAGDVVVSGAFTDSATLPVKFTPSETDTAQRIDANTVVLSLIPSEVDVAADIEAQTVRMSLIPSGSDIEISVDASTVVAVLTPSSADIAQYTESNTISFHLTPSDSDIAAYVESNTILLNLTPSNADITQYVESSILVYKFTPSGVETQTGQTIDTGTVLMALSPSATEAYGYTDSGISIIALSPSSSDLFVGFDTNTGLLMFTPSSTDIDLRVDSAILPLLFSPSGSDLGTLVDSAIGGLALVPSGSESASYSDSSTLVEALTASGTDIKVISDAASSQLLLTPSSIDTYGYSDAATVVALLRMTGADIQASIGDEGTVVLHLTVAALIEVQKIVELIGTVYNRWTLNAYNRWLGKTVDNRFVAMIFNRWFSSQFRQRWSGKAW